MRRGWQFIWVVVAVTMCACGQPRNTHDKDLQNTRGIQKITEARQAFDAAEKEKSSTTSETLKERGKTRAQQAREWFEKAASETTHEVVGSDTAALIASHYGIRQDLLERANPKVDLNNLKVDQKLKIPGHPGAQFNLGAMHDQGQGGLKKDSKAALEWYQKAAGQGFTDGEFMVGRFHQKGWGIPRDAGKAAEWYERAARKGHAAALNNLGTMRYKGDGIERNLVEAYKWYALAAKQSGEGTRKNSRGQAHEEIRGEKDPRAWAAAVKQVVSAEFPDKANLSDAQAQALLNQVNNGEQRALEAYLRVRTDDLVERAAEGDDAATARDAIAKNFLNEREAGRARQLVEDFKFEKDPFAP